MAVQKVAMISSTILDLPDHRERVRNACLSQGVLPLLKNGLKLRQKLHGERHPDTAAAYHELGKVYLRLGQPLALDYLKKAFEIRRELLGDENVFTTISLQRSVMCKRAA